MDTLAGFFTDAAKYIINMRFGDICDVLIIAAVIYWLIGFIRRTNSSKVAYGIVILLIVMWLSGVFRLSLTNYLLKKVFEIGVVAVIVLFQPEIRRSLERVGSRGFFFLGKNVQSHSVEAAIMQTVFACEDMSRSHTGALIVFERDNRLNDIIVTGTTVDSLVNAELLKNIFYDKAPLHDGAVIIKDGRIAAAGCVLPLSANANLSRDLGMRHRAGIGMSEHSDAVVVIVSEESGAISIAVDGMLKRHLSQDTFETLLRRELLPQTAEDRPAGRFLSAIRKIFDGKKGEENASEQSDDARL